MGLEAKRSHQRYELLLKEEELEHKENLNENHKHHHMDPSHVVEASRHHHHLHP